MPNKNQPKQAKKETKIGKRKSYNSCTKSDSRTHLMKYKQHQKFKFSSNFFSPYPKYIWLISEDNYLSGLEKKATEIPQIFEVFFL